MCPTQNSANTYITVGAAREVTMPLQPAFYASIPAAILDVTGDGTVYTIAASTEVYDVNNDYNNGNYTFTSPITCKCLFSVCILVDNFSANATSIMGYITTSNRTYPPCTFPSKARITTFRSVNYYVGIIEQASCDMDAGDTTIFQFQGNGGSKTTDCNYATINGYLIG
jgi:hypothetical protein